MDIEWSPSRLVDATRGWLSLGRRAGHGLGVLLAAWSAFVSPAMTRDLTVDLELVLAVDVSLSMDLEEQRLQRDGYVSALRDPAVQRAVLGGGHGRIALTYMEWAGAAIQQVVIPWRLLDTHQKIEAFAADLAALPIARARRTSISMALNRASALFGTAGYRGVRRVVDVSGDGPNNAGPPVTRERDTAVAQGIVVNGLPIMIRPSSAGSWFDIAQLDVYYRDCVIGGPGAFVLPVRDTAELTEAIRKKLILEISEPLFSPRLVPVQASEPNRVDCMVGERRWQEYWQNRLIE